MPYSHGEPTVATAQWGRVPVHGVGWKGCSGVPVSFSKSGWPWFSVGFTIAESTNYGLKVPCPSQNCTCIEDVRIFFPPAAPNHSCVAFGMMSNLARKVRTGHIQVLQHCTEGWEGGGGPAPAPCGSSVTTLHVYMTL